MSNQNSKSFTLVELLIVLAIIAILATVLILTIKPGAIFSRARDTQRIGDLKNIEKIMDAIYSTEYTFNELNYASPNVVYISLPDNNTNCSNWLSQLPSIPSGWSYHCSVTPTNIDGTGWIPIPFSNFPILNISQLPIDPLNQPPYYYSFVVGGSYEVTALLERDNKEFIVSNSQTRLTPVSRGRVGLADYSYRRQITINNTSNSNNLTDYQVLVTLDTASLISAGKMKSDCGDIRFTDSNGTTLLNYWIESDCNSANTRIWVKVPSIPANSTKTIYVYYGNLGATSLSNGTATFDWFDDFDPDKVSWTVLAGTWSNVAGYQGNSKKGVHDGTAGSRKSLADGFLSLADFVLEANVRNTIDNSLANIVFRAATNGNNDNNRIWVRLDQRSVDALHFGGFHLFENVGGTEYVRAYYDFDPVVSQWYKIKVQVHGNSAEGFLDGVQRWSTTALSRTAAGYIQLQVEDLSGRDAWFDNVFIRKYTSPEPTTSVGAEERL